MGLKHTFIIAEAGVNHNGDLSLAKKMIEKAAEAGADAVKFQTFTAEKLVSPNAPKAGYQIRTTTDTETQFTMLKRLELDQSMHEALISHCRRNVIQFLSSPFDLEGIDLLKKLGIKTFKIPSGEITNLPYLKKIGRLKKSVILSTGMANLDEIRAAIDILTTAGTFQKHISILHCNTQYPTPMADVHLNAMATIKSAFPSCRIGYSDHTKGIEIPIAAVAMGAAIIEKHFTLDRKMEGPDHKASLEPLELKQMVNAIRNVETALGKNEKKPSPSEQSNIAIVRKSIVAATDIRKGERFTEANLTVKRPGTGISPMLWDKIIGTSAHQNYFRNSFIEIETKTL